MSPDIIDSPFDLRRYLQRIGYAETPEPTLRVLRSIVAYHTATIPFETIDVLLRRSIRLDLPTLQSKTVGQLRGSYCFEQNALLQEIRSAYAAALRDCFGLELDTADCEAIEAAMQRRGHGSSGHPSFS